jgi:aminoglycoside phosphotransferase (APT) family kinase protein
MSASKSPMNDQAGAVRIGEELELKHLSPWLQARIEDLRGQPTITQYSGGASNWTYCLSYASKDVILRRAPAGRKAKGAHDMGREYRLQKALKPHYRYVPIMLAHCDDESIIGAEFYVMEKVAGVIPRKNLPSGLELKPAQAKQLCMNAIDSLAELHSVDYQSAGLDTLAKGTGYIERQVEGWIKRYNNVSTWNVVNGLKIQEWLRNNQPSKEIICLTHNDFRLDNLVLDANDPTKIIGVLDWELATLGDPLMDLANTLAYWVEEGDDFLAQWTRRQPTHLPGMLTRLEVVDYYLAKSDYCVSDFTFYEVFASFRLAAIAQQIYYRYHHGQTKNKQFRHLWVMVNYLMYRCKRTIKQSVREI